MTVNVVRFITRRWWCIITSHAVEARVRRYGAT